MNTALEFSSSVNINLFLPLCISLTLCKDSSIRGQKELYQLTFRKQTLQKHDYLVTELIEIMTRMMELLCWDFETIVLMVGKDKSASEAVLDWPDIPYPIWFTADRLCMPMNKYCSKLRSISVGDLTYIKYHKAVCSNKPMTL